MHNARIARACHVAETTLTGIVDIARGVHELRMIEDIERLCTELKLSCFCDPRIFQQGHVKVVDARAAKVSAHSVSHLPRGFESEVIGVEIRLPATGIAISKQASAIVGIAGLIDCVIECSTERIVIIFIQLDGFSLRERRDTRQRPTCSEPFWRDRQ